MVEVTEEDAKERSKCRDRKSAVAIPHGRSLKKKE